MLLRDGFGWRKALAENNICILGEDSAAYWVENYGSEGLCIQAFRMRYCSDEYQTNEA
jgi:hypothetical protein